MTPELKTNNKLILKLDEESSVKFKLSINGSVSNPAQTTVTTRFVVTENATDMSWMFPLHHSEEDGVFIATIPGMPSVFSEDLEYTGKLEVIVGNRYFNPSNIALGFERGISAVASPILTEVQGLSDNLNEEDQEALESVIKPQTIEKKQTLKKPELPFDESVIHEAMFSSPEEKRRKLIAVQTAQEKVRRKRYGEDPGREKYKNKLKSIIAEAWKEIAD